MLVALLASVPTTIEATIAKAVSIAATSYKPTKATAALGALRAHAVYEPARALRKAAIENQRNPLDPKARKGVSPEADPCLSVGHSRRKVTLR